MRPGPRRTKTQRQQQRALIAEQYVRGITQAALAARFGLSRQQVTYDLKVLRAEWEKRALQARNDLVATELAKLDAVEKEFWETWERSKLPLGAAEGAETSRRRSRSRDGNHAYLQGVLSCIDRRCKLLGLDAPVTVDVEEDVRAWARREGVDEAAAVREARRQIKILKSEDAERDAGAAQ